MTKPVPSLNGVKRLQVTNLQKNKKDYPQLSKLSKIYNINNMSKQNSYSSDLQEIAQGKCLR